MPHGTRQHGIRTTELLREVLLTVSKDVKTYLVFENACPPGMSDSIEGLESRVAQATGFDQASVKRLCRQWLLDQQPNLIEQLVKRKFNESIKSLKTVDQRSIQQRIEETKTAVDTRKGVYREHQLAELEGTAQLIKEGYSLNLRSERVPYQAWYLHLRSSYIHEEIGASFSKGQHANAISPWREYQASTALESRYREKAFADQISALRGAELSNKVILTVGSGHSERISRYLGDNSEIKTDSNIPLSKEIEIETRDNNPSISLSLEDYKTTLEEALRSVTVHYTRQFSSSLKDPDVDQNAFTNAMNYLFEIPLDQYRNILPAFTGTQPLEHKHFHTNVIIALYNQMSQGDRENFFPILKAAKIVQ